MVYIAQEGVTTTDLFRRNGNPTDLRMIIKRLSEGKEIDYTNYNFYTLASVIKVRFFSLFILIILILLFSSF
jgi:hypothetical protein